METLNGLKLNANRVTESYQNYANLQGLNDLRRTAQEDQRAALRPVAEQFEAIFLQQILKESRNVSFDEGWLDGDQGDFFKDWHDKQLSQDLSSKGSLGFADLIVDQLAPDLEKQVGSVEELMQRREQAAVQEGVSTQDALALRQAVTR